MQAPLKVCIFTETYHPVVGGGETQARLLAERLTQQGCPVTVLTRRTDGSQAARELHGRVEVLRLPPSGPQHLKKWGLLLTSIPALFALRHQYDVVLVSGFRVIGLAAIIVTRLLGKPCLLKADSNGEMSGEFFRGGLKLAGLSSTAWLFTTFIRLRNKLLARANAFVAISSQIAEEYARHGVGARSQIAFIPNCVDVNLFHPVAKAEKAALRQRLGLPPAGSLVVFTGRLVSYKGLPGLVRVWQRLASNRTDTTLVLVGSGSLDIHNCERQLREMVARADMEDRVLFCGDVGNVHEYLQAADAFVFPSENEAFGVALIEAMACGLPVIATPVGGAKDLLVHGQNGLVVEPGDEQGLFCQLEALLADCALARRLGLTAAQTVQRRYSVEAVTDAYVCLFQDVAGRRRRVAGGLRG
jgi:glycosyltransferase involved in cell wall biosynthesis